MRKLIVGCGYLGRRVARAWISDGHSVSALTRSSVRAAELSGDGIRPIVGDICDPSTLAELPAADTVLFAVGYDRSSGHSQQAVYVDGLRNVLQTIACRTGRLIYVSSSSVYGQSAGEWVDESSPCRPVQPGGEYCLAAERLVTSYFNTTKETFEPAAPTIDPAAAVEANPGRNSSANVLRLSGIYGPGRLLSRVESLRVGEPLSGRGEAWLNLIHVDDAVRAVRACEELGQPGRTYLVSDDLPIRRAEYYGLLAELSGAPPPRFNPDSAPARGSGGINKRCLNRRIREELGVVLAYPTINEGLPQSLQASAGPTSVPPAG